MIVTLTKKELEAIENKEAEAERRLREAHDKTMKLRPEDTEPKYDDDTTEETIDSYNEWYVNGSEEWKKAYAEEMKLYFSLNGTESIRSEAIKKKDDDLLKRITKTQLATVKDLKRQVGIFLQTEGVYKKTKSGEYLPNHKYIRERLSDIFYKPIQTLDAEYREEIANYIDLTIEELPALREYTPKLKPFAGVGLPQKGVKVPKGNKLQYYYIYSFVPAEVLEHKTTGEYIATRPKDYVTTVDRATQKLFENRLTHESPDVTSKLYLNSRKTVAAYVAVDYSELLKDKVMLKIPELNQRDYSVHDAIITQLNAGNQVMSYDMIYRAMTGKVDGKVTVPDEARKIIDEALDKFRGTFNLVYNYVDENGNETTERYDEPLVSYRRLVKEEKINGKVISGGIAILSDADGARLEPPLLRWARFNGNEIDTRDITLLDVPRLNNGDESFTIKMCLYRRLISMRNIFERKYHSRKELPDNKRSIRYDYIYEALGLSDPNPDKRKLLKNKIDRCMSYWKTKGFIADYRHKKDKNAGNAYYAVEVDFME